jgi:hypothetical protein
MGLPSSNPVLATLDLTQPVAPISQAITEIHLGNGQGEFSYDPTPILITNTQNEAVEVYININTQQYTTEKTDITVSLNEMLQSYPNIKKVHLDIGWYVTSLNCAATNVQPGVTTAILDTMPYEWQVAGINRADAYVVSQINGLPAFRGTPSDQSILNLLLSLSSLEINVSVCLTVIPDISSNNNLLNPYSDNNSVIGQPAYPPASQLTISPAKNYAGSTFGTTQATDQIATFFGNQSTSAYSCIFSSAGILTSTYNESILDTSYSNFVIYYATMLSSFIKEFGGVTLTDFYIGRGLSTLTSTQGVNLDFPAVDYLITLAEQSASLFLGTSVNISYVADWNEWQGSQNEKYPTFTATASRIFSMDALWSNSAISYIAIQANFPTTDWRNYGSNIDGSYYPASTNQPYLVEGILGQQYWDWYYQEYYNSADGLINDPQINQQRTTIAGPTSTTTWIQQLKNYDAWIENIHYNFDGYNFSSVPTSWVPNSKSVYLYNIVCPSINLATNQPDAILHQSSGEYSFPFASNGQSDNNVGSNFYSIYSTYIQYASPNGNITNWSAGYWDDRPYPWYPKLTFQWSDCSDYSLNQAINNKFINVDPTATYTQYVNYNLLMTEQYASNPFWTTLVSAMDLQWNNLFNSSINELQNVRNVNAIEDELKAATVRQMGFVVPDYGLQYYQYDSLMRYLGTFYLTRGNSKQFANFVSFFSQVPFQYVPLYANGLVYASLSSNPGTLITQSSSGTWIPTPYYDVYYDASAFPELDEPLYRQLLVESAPIYLVLRTFAGKVTITPVAQYLSASFFEKSITATKLKTPTLPSPGQYLLTINAPSSATNGVPFTVTGTTLGPSDSITVNLYQTNNLSLILSNRATSYGAASGSSINNSWSLSITPSTTNSIYAVVTDTLQTTKNGTITLNEVAISNIII